MSLLLRALNLVTDIDLFREAYSWRNKKLNKLRPDKMSFEDFTVCDPSQIVMGLFDSDQLQAVYLIKEGPTFRGESFIAFRLNGFYDTHFSSRRDAPKANVLAGARQLLKWLLDNGAHEVAAYVSEHNVPLGRFVEAIGFKAECFVSNSSLQSQNDSCTLRPMRFVKFTARG